MHGSPGAFLVRSHVLPLSVYSTSKDLQGSNTDNRGHRPASLLTCAKKKPEGNTPRE